MVVFSETCWVVLNAPGSGLNVGVATGVGLLPQLDGPLFTVRVSAGEAPWNPFASMAIAVRAWEQLVVVVVSQL